MYSERYASNSIAYATMRLTFPFEIREMDAQHRSFGCFRENLLLHLVFALPFSLRFSSSFLFPITMEKRLVSVLLSPPANSNCEAIEMVLWMELTRMDWAKLAYQVVKLRRFAAHEVFIIPVTPIMAAIPSLIGRQIPWSPKRHDS